MSDYEGEWEPIAVRGKIFTPTNSTLAVPPNPAHNYIVPKGRSFEEAEKNRQEKRERSRKSSAVPLPRDYRQALQSLKPGVVPGNYTSQDARSGKPVETAQQKVQNLPSFRRYRENPTSPDETHYLTRSIKNITASLSKQPNVEPAQIFRERLLAICVDTSAYISISDAGEHACNIWGEPEQIRLAKDSLNAFEMRTTAAANRTPAWSKIGAFDGRVENRAMRESWKNRERQFFQQETDDTTLAYQAHLFWPDGYDLDKFIQDYSETILQDLMNKYDCIIRQQTVERIIKVSCDTQQVLFQVYNRLMGLVREMVARQQPGLYATHCEVPCAESYRDRVQFTKAHIGLEPVNIPVLTGKSLPRAEYEKWTQLSAEVNKKYRLATKNALRSCIKGMHLSRKDIRLRVIFGDLGLVQVMRSADGQPTYHIDDFLTKVQHQGTRVTQCPLQEGASLKFLDNIESSSDLTNVGISWEISFDFSGEANKTLQLVKEYIPNIADPDEPSPTATRWLTQSNFSAEGTSDLFSVNHIDLDRVGYQLYLGGGAIFQNEKTLRDLRSFEQNIKFRPSLEGLRFDPKKHVVHPYGNRELTTLRETTIAKYRFRETRGTFEIHRIDHFNCKPGEASPIPYRTDWTATYYYAGWDNLLSDFAIIEPGQDLEWKRDLQTLFPKVEDPDNPQTLPLGFKQFMNEVDQLQTLVARALGRVFDDPKNSQIQNRDGHNKHTTATITKPTINGKK